MTNVPTGKKLFACLFHVIQEEGVNYDLASNVAILRATDDPVRLLLCHKVHISYV